MEPNRRETLIQDIQKQTDLGFSAGEIQQNLSANGYTQEEIAQVATLVQQSAGTEVEQKAKFSPWSLIISVFLIIRGTMAFSQGRTTMGSIMVGVGFIGFIMKIISMQRK